MQLRKKLKHWLYGSCPGFAGAFPYYGTKVYFPKDSFIFKLACEQGIYESDNLYLLIALIKPHSVYFDIGANIGLMSVPVLQAVPSCQVVSVEPSPNTLGFLQRTAMESNFNGRWRIVGDAMGSKCGVEAFHMADPALGAFDGLSDTKRAGDTKEVNISVTTLDSEWAAMDHPPVSVLKIDVEGAEMNVLEGAVECISRERPSILLEWNLTNLDAYSCKVEALLEWAEQFDYRVFSLPHLVPTTDYLSLTLQMMKTESFLLYPKPKINQVLT